MMIVLMMEYYNIFVEWYRIRYRIRYWIRYRIRYLYYLCSMFLPWDSCSEIDVLECQRDSISPLAFHEIGHTPTECSRTCGDGREGGQQDCQWWWNSTRLRSTRGLVWEGYPIDHKGWTQFIQPAWSATIAAPGSCNCHVKYVRYNI